MSLEHNFYDDDYYDNDSSRPNLARESYRLSDYITPAQLTEFSQQTGLSDFYWQVIYHTSLCREKKLPLALQQAEGFVFFIHGWDGSHRIWEDLPIRLALESKHIVCFSFDVNGFGRSPFLVETPSPEQASPIALMQAIDRWIDLINLRQLPERQHPPFYLFVGHSMGGAALFFKQEQGWEDEAYGLYALSPALLCNDVQRQTFYKTLGTGIAIPSFSTIKKLLAPHIIDVLGAGASAFVKQEHVRIFSETPFGTLAQTFYAMGELIQKPERNDWPRFQVALGHKDRLVGLDHMLDLLDDLQFHSSQIRLALGDHYFFSHDRYSPPSHRHNRDMVLTDLLAFCERLTAELYALY